MRDSVVSESSVASSSVHIGMPSHGDAPYLAEALDSVLAQTWTDWHVRVSENAPRRGGVSRVVEPYLADPRITYVTTGRSLSPAANHTNAIRGVSSRYVTLLQDDDIWEPTFLERTTSFLESHEDCGLAFVRLIEIDAQGSEIGRARDRVPPGTYGAREIVPLLLSRNVIGAPGAVLVRRVALEAAGPYYDERFPGAFDLELWMRLVLEAPVGAIDESLLRERAHHGRYSVAVEWGAELLRLQTHFVELAARRRPEIAIEEATWRHARSGALLSRSLDELIGGEPGRSLSLARDAFRLDHRRAVDRRMLGIAAGLLLGPLGPHAVLSGRRHYRTSYSGDPAYRRKRRP